MKYFVSFVTLSLVACAGTITGGYGSDTASAFNPQTTVGITISNGAYTIFVENLGSPQGGGCIPPPLDGSSTGIWYGPLQLHALRQFLVFNGESGPLS